MKAVFRAFLLLIALIAIVGIGVAHSITRKGLSTRVAPSGAEETLAWTMRRLATPAAVRLRPNPLSPTADVLNGALEHYADHCATCHANNGSGDTPIGRGLYPPAPDMRAVATQNLSDGELFSIIENGIRLTGMPAWGTGTRDGQRESWALVHFIRRLPKLTPEELARMESLNPKSPDEFREEEETRRFLTGEEAASAAPVASPATPHKPHE
jgi:mono/diheme cytochrome c family protein